MKHCYHELREGEKVIKRLPTSPASENKDRLHLERYHQKKGQEVHFIMSSAKEKVID